MSKSLGAHNAAYDQAVSKAVAILAEKLPKPTEKDAPYTDNEFFAAVVYHGVGGSFEYLERLRETCEEKGIIAPLTPHKGYNAQKGLSEKSIIAHVHNMDVNEVIQLLKNPTQDDFSKRMRYHITEMALEGKWSPLTNPSAFVMRALAIHADRSVESMPWSTLGSAENKHQLEEMDYYDHESDALRFAAIAQLITANTHKALQTTQEAKDLIANYNMEPTSEADHANFEQFCNVVIHHFTNITLNPLDTGKEINEQKKAIHKCHNMDAKEANDFFIFGKNINKENAQIASYFLEQGAWTKWGSAKIEPELDKWIRKGITDFQNKNKTAKKDEALAM